MNRRLISRILLCLCALPFSPPTGAAETLRIMTFNIWVGGESGKQPLMQTMEVIRAAKADVVGLQETHGQEKGAGRPDNGRKVAEMLGWHYFDQGERTGILSRFPIVTNTPRKWGVTIRTSSGRNVQMFNAHLAHAPYQPYQLLKIPYANAPFITTAEEAVREARQARGSQVTRLLAELQPSLSNGSPVFLTGDFNEPSHQDWTPRAAAAGIVPLPVSYPTTGRVVETGLRDAFRAMHPDEVARPGRTWTPITSLTDPKDRHDRIDFVFFAGKELQVTQCEIVGEEAEFADIVVKPYPSDHRAVVATINIP